MNILLIDNITKHLSKLQELLKEHTVTTIHFNEIPPNTKNYDAIILTGGSILGAQKHKDGKFSAEIQLIQQTAKPILGICMGFQLLALAYGGKLEQGDKIEGWETITVTKNKLLSAGTHQFYKIHKWYVTNPGRLEITAQTEHIQMLQHPDKPHFGICFHPELSGEEGKKLIKKFLELLN